MTATVKSTKDWPLVPATRVVMVHKAKVHAWEAFAIAATKPGANVKVRLPHNRSVATTSTMTAMEKWTKNFNAPVTPVHPIHKRKGSVKSAFAPVKKGSGVSVKNNPFHSSKSATTGMTIATDRSTMA